jgi:hypothetical protein
MAVAAGRIVGDVWQPKGATPAREPNGYRSNDSRHQSLRLSSGLRPHARK